MNTQAKRTELHKGVAAWVNNWIAKQSQLEDYEPLRRSIKAGTGKRHIPPVPQVP